MYIVGGFLGYQWADFNCDFEMTFLCEHDVNPDLAWRKRKRRRKRRKMLPGHRRRQSQGVTAQSHRHHQDREKGENDPKFRRPGDNYGDEAPSSAGRRRQEEEERVTVGQSSNHRGEISSQGLASESVPEKYRVTSQRPPLGGERLKNQNRTRNNFRVKDSNKAKIPRLKSTQTLPAYSEQSVTRVSGDEAEEGYRDSPWFKIFNLIRTKIAGGV